MPRVAMSQRVAPSIPVVRTHGRGYNVMIACKKAPSRGQLRGLSRSQRQGPGWENRLICSRAAAYIMGQRVGGDDHDVGEVGSYRDERRAMKMRLVFCLCVAVASAVLAHSALSQQPARVALLIGNANYPDASTPLSTTIRDARTLADEFRRTEFDVDLKENVGREDMQRAIDAFIGKIRSGMTALFYFSGYGIQVARQTYLIPVNAQVWTEAEVRRDGISLDALLAEMQRRGAKVKIVIIDASRRNPFERRFRASAAGLAALDAPDGTLAMYSAAPGKVINEGSGPNSLFVGELIKELRVPNLTAEEVFNRARIGVSRASNNEQVPWVASSLIDEFYFGSPRPVAAAPSAAPTPAPAPAPTPQRTPAPQPAAPAPAPSATATAPSASAPSAT